MKGKGRQRGKGAEKGRRSSRSGFSPTNQLRQDKSRIKAKLSEVLLRFVGLKPDLRLCVTSVRVQRKVLDGVIYADSVQLFIPPISFYPTLILNFPFFRHSRESGNPVFSEDMLGFVVPTKAWNPAHHPHRWNNKELDSRFRGNDGKRVGVKMRQRPSNTFLCTPSVTKFLEVP